MEKEPRENVIPGIFDLKHRSISKELAVSLILLIILVEGILLLYVYSRQTRLLRQELENKADDYAISLAEVLAVPVWDFDDEQIGKIAAGFAKNDVVDEIQIMDSDDKPLYVYRGRHSGEDRIERSVNIVYKGRRIGRAKLFVTLDAYEMHLARLRNVIFLVMPVSLIVIFITTGILMRIFMRKPIGLLQNGIDRVAKGDYSYRFDKIRYRELSGIANRFSEMANEIQARERSLQEVNRALQQEIAERKRAEEKIRESEAKSRALLDGMPDLVFQFDRSGIFLDYKGSEEDLAILPSKFLNKNIREIMPSRTADLFIEKLELTLNTHQVQVFEYELSTNRNHSYFECRMVALPPGTVMAIVRNITESKQAIADKFRLEEQLRNAQKMEAIGTLAGGVAHDLNNILSGLVSYPELILMDLPKDSPLKAPILTIQKSGEKAANIVHDLLTLARRGVSVSEVINLNHIITDYLKSPEHAKLEEVHARVRFTLDLAPELLNISGSPVHLSKTVMNLVANAAEAMPHGGEVSISTRNRYIDRSVRGYDDIREGEYVTLEISDTGIGIPAKDLERIFEPFYTRKIMGRSGTGLGMAVVWGTVKDHKGYIDIQSTEGKGTRFVAYFPATREGLQPEKTRVSLDAYTGNGETILIVDDIKEQREIASRMLEKLGYTVKTVSSGEEGVAYLRHNTADLVLLDMIMDPGIDGLETYKRILAHHPGQKAVIVSGFSESERVREAETLGAGAYVKKPYLLEQIAVAIKTELNR